MESSSFKKYDIEIKKSALKAMQKLPTKHRAQVQASIDVLAANPRPLGVKKMVGEKLCIAFIAGYTALFMIFLMPLWSFAW